MLVLHDWLKEYCGEWIPTVKEIEDIFTFHAFEIEGAKTVGNHEVIDVKILPDRASDCLSHRGIARELAALMDKTLTQDPFVNSVELTPSIDDIHIQIHEPEYCRRFAVAAIDGVAIGPSPEWLTSRLEALGQRSINNVVDATNYVMLALGQPLHAYDADKLTRTDRGIRFGVRMARTGEEITTLTNDTYVLTTATQLVVDGASDTPLAVAGVKGGKTAEIDMGTTRIVLEAANFNPEITRKSSQILKLQTDASKRFENNLSPDLVPYALRDVVLLVLDIAGGEFRGYVDEYPTKQSRSTVTVSLARINALLGIQLSDTTIEQIFTRLGFTFERSGEGWDITPPFERADINIAEDLIAEVGRVYGYEHVESVVPLNVPLTEYNAKHYYSEKIREVLFRQGFSEVITSSFRKKDTIELHNALASDKRFLRSSLVFNIRETLERNMPNIDLLGLNAIRVFEIGTVFVKNVEGDDVVEHVSLALGVRTKQQGYTPKDDVMLREVIPVLEEALGMSLHGNIQEGVFECNLSALISKLPIPTSYDAYTPRKEVLFAPYSTYPFISRDIALWVPESVSQDDVEKNIREKGGMLLTECRLFDEFKKEGKVSYAFRLIFQSFEKTLTDEEVGKVMDSITDGLKAKGFEVR
jgi:phenylalanyl-tRNA synthetase beta chain